MIHTETKFAYHHKPTGKWCHLFYYYNEMMGHTNSRRLEIIDDFHPDILYNARNIIEEDLLRSIMNGERYAAQNFLEFELVEIEIEYRLKA